MELGGGARTSAAWVPASSCGYQNMMDRLGGELGQGWRGRMRDRADVGCRTRLDRQDLRLQLDEGSEVCTAGLEVVLAGAVGAQDCHFLVLAVFEQAVRGVPVGTTVKDTPVEHPIGVALDEGRAPVDLREHTDAGRAVGVAAGEDCAIIRLGEDAVVAVGGAVERVPEVLDRRHSLTPLGHLGLLGLLGRLLLCLRCRLGLLRLLGRLCLRLRGLLGANLLRRLCLERMRALTA
jgi:hypothetical protein